jgi:hypothetical protein
MKLRHPSGSLAISIALHIVLGAGLLWVLSIPNPLVSWFREPRREPVPVERISFLALPNRGTTTPGRSGGDNRPVARQPARAQRPLAPPRQIPEKVPPAPPAVSRPSEEGKGPVVGKGGLEEGVTPSYSDPRLWLPPGDVVSAPTRKTYSERLDSVLAARVQAHNDSLAAIAANAARAPGDWTFSKNGKKYGIDSKKIYLGDFSIPTAILALLPLNRGGNPTEVAAERALNFQRREIQEQAQRAMNAEEFREAVKRIRERKQREHDEEMRRREEAKKKQQQQQGKPIADQRP